MNGVTGCNLHLNVNIFLLTVEALSLGFERSAVPVITSYVSDSCRINGTRLLALVPSFLGLILSSSTPSLPVLKQNTF